MKHHWVMLCLLLCSTIACTSKKETTTVLRKSITSCVYASGIVKSNNQYEAYTNVSGIIAKVWVKEGDTVKQGDPIISLVSDAQQYLKENAQLAAAYASMQANQIKLQEAAAQRDAARNKMYLDSSVYFRQKNLFAQDIGTKNDLEQRELSYTNSKASYLSALSRYEDIKHQLELQDKQQKNIYAISEKQLADYTLRSEINGIVYKINKQRGELVSPQLPVALIGDANNFIIELLVDERDITKIKNGLTVFVTLDSYKGESFEARISRIHPMMDARTKTFTVEATFVNQPPLLYPFVTLEASIVLQEKKDALLIPVSYLLNDSTVLNKDGKEIKVTTGLRDFTMVEILSGLSENDEIVKKKK
jgi:multidrug efflux pump subunit AcrA (membrane-fusion protein)